MPSACLTAQLSSCLPQRGTTTCSIIAGGIATWDSENSSILRDGAVSTFRGISIQVVWDMKPCRQEKIYPTYDSSWTDTTKTGAASSLTCLPTYIMSHPEDLYLHRHRCDSFKFQIKALSCKLHIRIYIRGGKKTPYIAEKILLRAGAI